MMIIRLILSQMVAKKLVENQRIDSPETITSVLDDDITSIYGIIR